MFVGDHTRRNKLVFGVHTNEKKTERVVSQWLPSEKQLNAALFTASKKLAQWARAEAVRHLKTETDLPPTLLRTRIKSYKRGKKRMSIFFGLRPVPVGALNPRQTRAGVSARGGMRIKKAFVVPMDEFQAVFKRRSGEYHMVHTAGGVEVWREKLDYQRLYFAGDAFDVIHSHIKPQLEAKFHTFLEHELKWRTSK